MDDDKTVRNQAEDLPAIAWGKKVSPLFKKKVLGIADLVGCEADWLMAVMAFETGETFSPSVRNPRSTAVGLIQFMRATATALGTTTDELATMTAEAQLNYVRRYMLAWKWWIQSLSDCYMAVLWPAAIGKADSDTLWSKERAAYRVNAGLDANKDGVITKGEAAAKVAAKLAKGRTIEWCG